MSKKLAAILGGLGLLLTTAVPVFATSTSVDAPGQNQASLAPSPLCHKTKVTPDKPLYLRGVGNLTAHGKGKAFIKVAQGRVLVRGKGVVGVKASDNDKIEVAGWGGKQQFGDWVFYWGQGKLQIRGDEYKLIALGKFSPLHARGKGSIALHGRWQVHWCRLLSVLKPIPFEVVIPDQLKAYTKAE